MQRAGSDTKTFPRLRGGDPRVLLRCRCTCVFSPPRYFDKLFDILFPAYAGVIPGYFGVVIRIIAFSPPTRG